jgi:hypothetical protein
MLTPLSCPTNFSGARTGRGHGVQELLCLERVGQTTVGVGLVRPVGNVEDCSHHNDLRSDVAAMRFTGELSARHGGPPDIGHGELGDRVTKVGIAFDDQYVRPMARWSGRRGGGTLRGLRFDGGTLWSAGYDALLCYHQLKKNIRILMKRSSTTHRPAVAAA